jgi:hypothetical protein
MPPIFFRRFISGLLAFAFLAHTCRALRRDFSATLTTTALDRSSSRWFGASACTAAPEGQTSISCTAPRPESGLLHPASFNVRVHTFARKGAVAKVTTSVAETSAWRRADRWRRPHRGAMRFRPGRRFSGLNSRGLPANVGNRERPAPDRSSSNVLQIGTIRAIWSPESHPGGRRFESG